MTTCREVDAVIERDADGRPTLWRCPRCGRTSDLGVHVLRRPHEESGGPR